MRFWASRSPAVPMKMMMVNRVECFLADMVDRMNLALPDLMVAQTHTRASLFSFFPPDAGKP